MEKQKSIKANIVLNALKGAFSILFPLISFPYISRILGVTNIGRYNFASSIINYFLLIAGLGISTYAIREGTKYRNEKAIITRFASEVYSINIISTIVSYASLFLCLIISNKLYSYKNLIVILSIQIAFQTIGIEWIYSIYEDYLYITLRSFIFQIVSLASMLLFVRKSEDVNTYAFITVISSVGSNVFNYFHAKKYCSIRFTTNANLKIHLKPIFILFAVALTVTIYVSSDITILGFLKDDITVGIYSTSVKVYTVVKKLLSSILVVSIPRLSLFWGRGKIKDFNHTAKDIYATLISVLMPTIVLIILLRKEIILILANESYIAATSSLSILSIALFFCMGAWFWGQCILVPMRQEGIVFKITIISAIINIVLNFILVPLWAENATALTTVIAESIAFLGCRHFGKKVSNIAPIWNVTIKVTMGCAFMVVVSCVVQSIHLSPLLSVIVVIVLSSIIYFISQVIMGNESIIPVLEKIELTRK